MSFRWMHSRVERPPHHLTQDYTSKLTCALHRDPTPYFDQDLLAYYHRFNTTSSMVIPILLLGAALLLTVRKVREHKRKKRALEAQGTTLPVSVEVGDTTGHKQLPAYEEEGLPPYHATETRAGEDEEGKWASGFVKV
jgi:hypothetical protein